MDLIAAQFHPSDIPHSDTLGVPTWLQWLVLAIALTIGGWLVLEARAERRLQSDRDAQAIVDEEDRLSTGRLVQTTRAGRGGPVPKAGVLKFPINPLGLCVLLIGLGGGWLALSGRGAGRSCSSQRRDRKGRVVTGV